MKVKDLREQLANMPEDATIVLDADQFTDAGKFPVASIELSKTGAGVSWCTIQPAGEPFEGDDENGPETGVTSDREQNPGQYGHVKGNE